MRHCRGISTTTTTAAGQRLHWRRPPNPCQRVHLDRVRTSLIDALASLRGDFFARLDAVVTRTLVY